MGVDVDVIAGFRSKDIVILEDEYKKFVTDFSLQQMTELTERKVL